MYELIQLTDKCYYISAPTNIGVIKTGKNEVCLIDSGRNEDEARLALERVLERDWKVFAIYNTHSHADHIGGNKYIQTVTGCRVFLTPTEIDLALHPCFEPSLLYGAYPPQDLRNWYMIAEKCDMEYLTEDVLPQGLSMMRLPGHTFHMVGFRTDEDVVFLADAIMGRRLLAKHSITYLYDTGSYLDTLHEIQKMQARYFVPSHSEAVADIIPLTQENIGIVMDIANRILKYCEQPMIFEDILQRMVLHYMLKLNFMQYALLGSTLRSYLAWLKDTKRIDVEVVDGKMFWVSTGKPLP